MPKLTTRSKRWIITTAVCIVVFVAGVIILKHWMNTDSSGTVQVGKPTIDTSATSTPLALDTPYFTAQLPAGFTLKKQSATPGSQTQLQLVADSSVQPSQQFAVTVGQLPTAGITEVGDYNLRAKDAATYVRFTPPSLPSGAVAFRTASGPSTFTVFWPHGKQYASIAFSTDSGASLDSLLTTYAYVLAQWNWK